MRDDLISRQAAIDALADYIHNVDKVYSTGHLSMSDCEDAARSVIDGLPSAQPEIIYCKDCKHGKYDIFDRGMWCELHPSLDVTEDDFCSFAERRIDDGE